MYLRVYLMFDAELAEAGELIGALSGLIRKLRSSSCVGFTISRHRGNNSMGMPNLMDKPLTLMCFIEFSNQRLGTGLW